MSSQCGSNKVTAETYKLMEERCELLQRKIDEGVEDLRSILGEEKDVVGSNPVTVARDDLQKLRDDLEKAQLALSNAEIVDCVSVDTVSIGSIIRIQTCRCVDGAKPEESEMLMDGMCGCGRTDIQVITPYAPLGAAVFGAKVGDEREFITPSGVVTQILIISISL